MGEHKTGLPLPRNRWHWDDFKCSAADAFGDLLVDLARFSGLDVSAAWLPHRVLADQPEFTQHNRKAVAVEATHGTSRRVLVLAGDKYYFPPSTMLAYLNDLLAGQKKRWRLWPCATPTGSPYGGREGIVKATAEEIEMVRGTGILVADRKATREEQLQQLGLFMAEP